MWKAFIILNLVFSQAVFAQQQSPIRIFADEVVVDDKNQISTYRGNVKFTQDEMTLLAETMKVYIKNKKLQRVEAEGQPVQFQQQDKNNGEIRAHADSMEYKAASGILWLREKAELRQSENQVSGDVIQYDTVKRAVLASSLPGDQRQIEITLDPETLNE